jgi:hypothetical protein
MLQAQQTLARKPDRRPATNAMRRDACDDACDELYGLLGWTCGCVCGAHKLIVVPLCVDFLCGAAVDSRGQLSLVCKCVLAGLVPCFGLEFFLVTQV